MPKASVKRLIECKKKDLIELVLDIEKYPEFVPFCFDAKIYENKQDGDLQKIIADLTDQILSGSFLQRPDWIFGLELFTGFTLAILITIFIQFLFQVESNLIVLLSMSGPI